MIDLQFFRARLIGAINTSISKLGGVCPAEIFYQVMFNAASRNINLPPLYPTKASANYSLLYLILRISTESGVTRALDIGAGQSTILLNCLNIETETVETDVEWARRIQALVKHPVHFRTLVLKQVQGRSAAGYDNPIEGKFDLMVVDGPATGPASRAPVRWASLDLLDNLSDEAVVVFDDASRPGVQEVIRGLLHRRPTWTTSWVHGQKSQCVVASPAFNFVRHY